MSTLVGIKRPAENGLGPISQVELVEAINGDASLVFGKDRAAGLSWSGDETSRGMEFNFADGEIWSAGSVDDATLNKMGSLAVRLKAKLVTEEGELFDLNETSASLSAEESPARGKVLFRVYVLALVAVAIGYYFFQR